MKLRPSFLISLSFFLIILTGAVFLCLPVSSAKGTFTNFLDAYFTSNSATCVTGLVTLDTGTHFTLFGQIIILILMQIGGLGYMTFSAFFVLLLKKKMFISERLMVQEAMNVYSSRETVNVLKRIFLVVFVIEAAGAIILFLRWLPEFGLSKALFWGIFHSVSAFNNAGFALPANFANLSPYVTDIIINLSITSLIILGGIGFFVLSDVFFARKFSLHSKIVLSATAFLIISATLAFLFLEYSNPNTIGGLGFGNKVMASYFQAVTPRTAGFNTINEAVLTPASLIITMFLMFIGASPGGTGGGVKTSTFAVIAATIRATLRGLKDTVIYRRRIPHEIVRRAFTITTLACMVVITAILFLEHFTQFNLMESGFEVFSAFGTVGLSMGITPKLSGIGKMIIIVVMFIGRVGPLTMALSLLLQHKEPRIEYPKENISIG